VYIANHGVLQEGIGPGLIAAALPPQPGEASAASSTAGTRGCGLRFARTTPSVPWWPRGTTRTIGRWERLRI